MIESGVRSVLPVVQNLMLKVERVYCEMAVDRILFSNDIKQC